MDYNKRVADLIKKERDAKRRKIINMSTIYTAFNANETVELTWIPVSFKMPRVYGWYVVALNPVNYKEFENDNKQMNSWRTESGCKVLWFENGEFWEDDKEITDRVTHWGYCPKVPMY